MEPFHYGVFILSMCWLMIVPGNCQYQDMVCEDIKSRHGRKMTEPGPGCDLSTRNWCNSKTENYPEDKIMGILLDNRGVMKRLFGNSREAKFLETAADNFPDEAPSRPPPSRLPRRRKPKKLENGKYHNTNVLAANSRHGKKISVSKPNIMRIKSNPEKQKYIRNNKDKEDIKITQTRFNDKVFSKTFNDPFKRIKLTTKSLDQFDTTQPTTFQDDLTTLQDYSTLEPEDSFTTEPTTQIEQLDDLVITTENGFTIEENYETQNVPIEQEVPVDSITIRSTTQSSIDSGDDLRYSTKGSTSGTTERVTHVVRPNTRNPEWKEEKLEGRMPSAQRRPYPSSNQGTIRHSESKPPNYKLRNNNANNVKPKPQVPKSPPPEIVKFAACNSTTEVIAPTWAKNIQGKNLIVVNVGSFMQHLHVEECERESLHKKMYCQRGCRCEQQYRLQKLLVIDPDDECRGIFSDWFRFPSCCVCVCYADFMGLGSRNARIFEDNDVDYFEGDEEYENDPFILHYYGLDSEEDTYVEDKEDMLASATKPDYIKSSISKPKRPNGISFEQTFKTSSRPTNNITRASPEKKSRLLINPSRSTINIRPQVAPRRYPPPRQYYNGPWGRPGWSQIANNKYPYVNNYQSSRRSGLFVESRSSKPIYPSLSLNGNVDTYYNQHRPRNNRDSKDQNKSNTFKRIPRSAP